MTSVIMRTVMAVLALLVATATAGADFKPSRIDVQYVPPKSPEYESLYKRGGCHQHSQDRHHRTHNDACHVPAPVR